MSLSVTLRVMRGPTARRQYKCEYNPEYAFDYNAKSGSLALAADHVGTQSVDAWLVLVLRPAASPFALHGFGPITADDVAPRGTPWQVVQPYYLPSKPPAGGWPAPRPPRGWWYSLPRSGACTLSAGRSELLVTSFYLY